MRMWQEEGFKGFMRGNGINCLRIVPYRCVRYREWCGLAALKKKKKMAQRCSIYNLRANKEGAHGFLLTHEYCACSDAALVVYITRVEGTGYPQTTDSGSAGRDHFRLLVLLTLRPPCVDLDQARHIR
jgi:hypothetical protein